MEESFGVDIEFKEKVVQYLKEEWMVDVEDYPQKIRDRAVCTIYMMCGKCSVPQTAGTVAMEVLPI